MPCKTVCSSSKKVVAVSPSPPTPDWAKAGAALTLSESRATPKASRRIWKRDIRPFLNHVKFVRFQDIRCARWEIWGYYGIYYMTPLKELNIPRKTRGRKGHKGISIGQIFDQMTFFQWSHLMIGIIVFSIKKYPCKDVYF